MEHLKLAIEGLEGELGRVLYDIHHGALEFIASFPNGVKCSSSPLYRSVCLIAKIPCYNACMWIAIVSVNLLQLSHGVMDISFHVRVISLSCLGQVLSCL